MIERAIRKQWKILDPAYDDLPDAMLKMAMDEELDERSRIAAARVLVAMHGQNQDDDPADKNINVNIRGLVAQVQGMEGLTREQLLVLAELDDER